MIQIIMKERAYKNHWQFKWIQILIILEKFHGKKVIVILIKE